MSLHGLHALSPELRVFSPTLLHMFSMVVARFLPGSVAMRYVLPVLEITSRFHMMARNRRREKGEHLVTVQGQHGFVTARRIYSNRLTVGSMRQRWAESDV